MLEFRSHSEDNGAEGIAGGADGIGGLFRMATLMSLATARTEAGLDIELGHDGNDGRQVGLILDDLAGIDKWHMAIGTLGARHVDDAIDLLGGGRRSQGRLMAFGPARPVAFFLGFAAAKAARLPPLLSAQLLELHAQLEDLSFQADNAPVPGFAPRARSGGKHSKPVPEE